jgi:hypothetical protein
LRFDPAKLKALSEKLIRSHWESKNMEGSTMLSLLCVRVGVLLAMAVISGPIVGVGAAEKTTLDFEKFEKGTLPTHFATGLTGGGGPVAWAIAEDSSSPRGPKVLAQTSTDNTDNRFPLCIYSPLSAKDVEVSVRFKAVAGKVDQAAGLVVRFRDKDNYYVARVNALEDNVRLYHVVAGERRQFAGEKAKVTSGEWHSLKLEAHGTHFKVFFDDKLLLEADDDTFKDAGKAGVWTKADSVTYFDDLEIETYDGKSS